MKQPICQPADEWIIKCVAFTNLISFSCQNKIKKNKIKHSKDEDKKTSHSV